MQLHTAIASLNFANSLRNTDDLNALINQFDNTTEEILSVGGVEITHLDAEWGGDSTYMFACLNTKFEEVKVKLKISSTCDILTVEVQNKKIGA